MGVLSFYRRESDLDGRKLPRKPRPLRRRSEPCSRSPVLNSLPSTRNLPRRILLQALGDVQVNLSPRDKKPSCSRMLYSSVHSYRHNLALQDLQLCPDCRQLQAWSISKTGSKERVRRPTLDEFVLASTSNKNSI